MKDCLNHDASTKAYKFLRVNYLSQHDKHHCQEKWIFSNILSWNESNTLIVLNQWIHHLHIKTDLLWHNWNFGWSEFVICSRCFVVSEMVSSVSKTSNLITLSLSLSLPCSLSLSLSKLKWQHIAIHSFYEKHSLSPHNLTALGIYISQGFKHKLLRKHSLPSHCLPFMFLRNPGLQRQKTDVFIWLQNASSPHGFPLSSQVCSRRPRI